MAELQLVVVTPETTLIDQPVNGLRFPLFDGQIGVLPGRAPVVGRLGYGELSASSAGGDLSYFIDGGFVQINGSVVSILTDRAMPSNEIDRAEAQAALETANSRIPTTDEEFTSKQRDLERARRMIQLAK
ncbi:MAG: F0F1 ATP synthase subunit epsilon [Planctomycetaceae bacterium]|nr:F0F1 ATP synthase subunit epsilon [Planctomycetaceae bacterium]